MKVDSKTLKDLEWMTVLKHLARYSSSELGKELCLNLIPMTDPDSVHEALIQTTEGKTMFQHMLNPPIGGIFDIREAVKKARIGSVLETIDFINIASTLLTARNLKNYMTNYEEEFPLLFNLTSFIQEHQSLIDSIYKVFDQSGNILDSASPLLKQLRSSLKDHTANLKEKINELLHAPSIAKYLQEPVYTIRNDRYVLPVKAEFKNEVAGIVHDSSASGVTYYIEPRAVVELSNKIKDIELKIEHEIERILSELTHKVALNAEYIDITLDILAKIDLIFAKAKYSQAIDAGEPDINESRRINLKLVRHPILINNLDKVVPNTVEMGDGYSTLIITGANTGGKTVLLKTIGLCVLMTAAGMHIPSDVGSGVHLYSSIFADIDDEQSIENNLSTFSSHVMNIIRIVENTDGDSLVLLDELGAGTDPAEGTALAQALLEYFHERDITTIVTTHYGGLKTLAYSHKGFRNASVEFDLDILRPTYRLLMDIPGQSNATTIAKSLGLRDNIVYRAEEIFNSSRDEISIMLDEFQKIQQDITRELEQAKTKNKVAYELKDKYEKLLDELNNTRAQSINSFRKNLNSELNKAKSEVIEIMDKLKSERTEKTARQAHSELAELGYKGTKTIEDQKRQIAGTRPLKEINWNLIKPGDSVFVKKIEKEGELISLPDDHGRVVVQIGLIKSTVKKNELSLPLSKSKEKPPEPSFKSPGAVTKKLRRSDISSSVDLRGKTIDEGLAELELYLDKAALYNINHVNIIHGHGTGLLRKAIRDYLKSSPYVRDFRPGESSEGGDGVSIVELK